MFDDGSIQTRTTTINGKTYRYLIYQFYDNAGKRHTKSFPDTPEGKKARAAYIKEVRKRKAEGRLAQSGYSVGEWIKEYLDTYVSKTVRDTTFLRLLQTAVKLESIAQVRLDKLTPLQVQNLYNLLLESISCNSVIKVHRLLFSAYKKAMVLREISYNPMEAVEPPKPDNKRVDIFTSLEIIQIFNALRRLRTHPSYLSTEHDYYPFFLLLLTTGMRIGELLALQWQDVDFTKREIHVHKTASHTAIHAPKTRSGDRLIPILHDATLHHLQALRKAGGTYKKTGYIYATSHGKPLSYHMVLNRWQAVCKHVAEHCKSCGQPRPKSWTCSCGKVVKRGARVCPVCGMEQPASWACSCGTENTELAKTLHTFRHTFATVLLTKNVPIKEVSTILGHAQASTTLDMYTHAIPNYNSQLIRKFSRAEKRKNKK